MPLKKMLAILITTFMIFCLGMPIVLAQSAGSVMVTPGDLVWKEMPTLPPGAEMAMIEGDPEKIFDEEVPFTFRLKLPADFEIPAHHHPWIEHATIISGTLHMGYGNKTDRSKTTTLPTGSVAVLQPDSKHFSWTEEETIVQIHGIGPLIIHYANPDEDPRN